MKWITREHAKVDKIACPWQIKNFMHNAAEFLFVRADKVIQTAKEVNGAPFDVPNVESGHYGEEYSFDATVRKYALYKKQPAPSELAKIVRSIDTSNQSLTPQSEGLFAIAMGLTINSNDDHDNMTMQFPVYDALLAFCKSHMEKAERKKD
jgi:hypothetical protein